MRAARILLTVVGTLTMGYAVAGALTDPDVKPLGVLLFLAGVLAVHDAVILPTAIAVGVLIGCFVPVAMRPAVRSAALASLAVCLLALPLVLGFGRTGGNSSVLPLPYGRGLLYTLGAIWAATAAVLGVGAMRRRRTATRRPIPRAAKP